jgi:hypothetical protein
VTICTPNTSNCQTISDILLDTGSFGLRVFKQVLTVAPTQITSGSGLLAECVQFGDGSSLWGPVQKADIILGSEPAVQIPIQVVDSTLPGAPTTCANAEQTPSVARFNGILGVGVFNYDCGPACESIPNIGIYFSCSGSTCAGTTVPRTSQVQNPVVSLPTDSNGVIVQLQSVPSGGAPSASGILVLGIGTRTNNMPTGVTVYDTNGFGEIVTVLNGNTYDSIIDSGSNGLFFTPPSSGILPSCASSNSAWFCPSSVTTLSATNRGASAGSPSSDVFFQIGNLTSLVGSSNWVFSNIGGAAPNLFDWGLPFYLGRNIYVGINGQASSLGTGPYFAY